MFRIIVAGSRSIQSKEIIFQKQDALFSNKVKQEEIQIVSGGARGVDRIGEEYAATRGFECKIFPADWNNLGKRAGYVRNCRMAENADALVAFWDGRSPGTKHMIQIARSHNLDIRIVLMEY